MDKTTWIAELNKELLFFYKTEQWDKYDVVFERLRLMGAFT